MRIGWLGTGKLGAPIVEVLHRQHRVQAYDLVEGARNVSSVKDAVHDADVVFIAVQTPHGPEYEGITRAPEETAPFDLTYLISAVCEVVDTLDGAPTPIAIVSTVLPGDCRRYLYPLLQGQPLIYNPAFVAMGTVEEDFLHPEFVLLGTDHPVDAGPIATVYEGLRIGPVFIVDLESAELTKVAYNTFISQKIVFSNALMEICEKLGRGNVDEVLGVLQTANKRITSGRYLGGGMGDAGPCHPRDSIAMSHLAQRLSLSVDPFSYVTRARENQTEWLALKAAMIAKSRNKPLVLCNRAYKIGVDMETGSAGLLMAHILTEHDIDFTWDDYSRPAVFVACLPLGAVTIPKGSTIIDPWGNTENVKGEEMEIISVGRF